MKNRIVAGSYCNFFHDGQWIADVQSVKTSYVPETYLWVKMPGVDDKQFEETKPHDGRWVTIEFGGGELVADSPMDDVTFNRILMEKHRVKVVLSTDGSNDIHLYKYKGE